MPKLVVHSRAARYIKQMDSRIKTQVMAKLKELAKNPGAAAGDL